MTARPRFALYYAPEPTHPLWPAGCRWLGRDPSRHGSDAAPREAIEEPRRYGFHATLKAPMRLRTGALPEAFVDAVAALASRMAPFEMPALEVGVLRGFVALCPAEALAAAHPLRQLADACVRELDEWRARPSPADMQRRLGDPSLSQAQRELLERWGHPHVFEQWRFHMTLSDALPDDAAGNARRAQLLGEARRHFADALSGPLTCQSVCVFTEPAEGQPFMLSNRIALSGA